MNIHIPTKGGLDPHGLNINTAETSITMRDDRDFNSEPSAANFSRMQELWRAINNPQRALSNQEILHCANLGHWQARALYANIVETRGVIDVRPLDYNMEAIGWFKKALSACEQRLCIEKTYMEDFDDKSELQELYLDQIQIRDKKIDKQMQTKGKNSEPYGVLRERGNMPLWKPNAEESKSLTTVLNDKNKPDLDRLRAGLTLADNSFERSEFVEAIRYYKKTLEAMPLKEFSWETK